MRSVASTVVALCLVGACGGPPRPSGKASTTTATTETSADPDGMSKPPEATPVEALCKRYVSLKPTKLEGGDREAAVAKCAGRLEGVPSGDPKYYGCLVQCTFSARTYEDARGCRSSCRGLPGEGPPPAGSAEPD